MFSMLFGTVAFPFSRLVTLLVIFCFNTCPANAQIDTKEVNTLIESKDWDGLEKMAASCRVYNIHGYSSNLPLFYEVMNPDDSDSRDAWDKKQALLEQWHTDRPKSAAASIALAKFHVAKGWKARGSGWANTVAEDAWKELKNEVTKAEDLLKATPNEERDPELYRTMLAVALGNNWPKARMEEAFQKGIAIQPYYYPLYEAKAHYLLPRWYGDSGDEVKFAEEATKISRNDDDQDAIYAVIGCYVGYTERSSLFTKIGFSWNRVKKGMLAISKNDPTSSKKELNLIVYFSLLAKDFATAQSTMTALEKNEALDLHFIGLQDEDIPKLRELIAKRIADAAKPAPSESSSPAATRNN